MRTQICIPARKGFTLIEMLVVIGIIAILAALLFPAIGKGILTARRNQAAGEAKSIAAAVELFFTDHGYMPVPAADQGKSSSPENFTEDESRKIIQVLMADPQNYNAGNQLNTRKKVYLDSRRPVTNGALLDPWGAQYLIKLDRDYDHKITHNSVELTARALVVSRGPSRELSGGPNNKFAKDNVANLSLP